MRELPRHVFIIFWDSSSGKLRADRRTFKRREAAIENQLEIAELAFAEEDGWEGLGLRRELCVTRSVTGEQVLEDAAMRSVGHCIAG